MTDDEQIKELHERVKVRIAPSKIHGVGLIALRPIKKGEKIYADHVPKVYTLRYVHFDKLFPYVRQLLLERWPQIVNGSNFLYPDTRLTAYMNHSDKPNVDAKNDVALKNIKAGEELTEDYRLIPNYHLVHEWLDK